VSQIARKKKNTKYSQNYFLIAWANLETSKTHGVLGLCNLCENIKKGEKNEI
jgi:hypothetical protein